MMDTAKLEGFVKQVQQFDVAVSNFKNKYKQLPGDTSLFPGPANNGNGWTLGNGLIEICYCSTETPTAGQFEAMNFWYHLSLSGDVTQQYSNDWHTYGLTAGVTMPATKLNPNIGLVALYSGDSRFPAPNQNVYLPIGNNPGGVWEDDGWAAYSAGNLHTGYNNGAQGLPFSCLTLSEIDTKMDDGMPNTGNVIEMDGTAFAGYPPGSGLGGGSDCTGGSAAATARYFSGGNTPSSPTSFAIAIMAQTGNNQ